MKSVQCETFSSRGAILDFQNPSDDWKERGYLTLFGWHKNRVEANVSEVSPRTNASEGQAMKKALTIYINIVVGLNSRLKEGSVLRKRESSFNI